MTITSKKTGVLYVVATPIGNLQDITLRAIETLKQVDMIAAEDTRRAGQLLKHLSINKPMMSLHEFNERERLAMVLDHLQHGESIALISDAGTPLINDPGFYLVREAKAQGIKVVPVPGACALIAALSASGLPTDKFTFEGFLPVKAEACKNRLTELLHETRTLIFYEAPHRLMSALESLQSVFGGERKAVIARELTKIHESILVNDLAHLLAYYKAHEDEQRGEIVILVAGCEEEKSPTKEVVPEQVLDILLEELPVKQAASLAAKITGERKNVLYDLALSKKA
jgi:16S rRNA (cytidine1402-2'-O)-methyltransferase